METPPAIPSPSTDVLARDLKGNVPCARCRYNLRGLSVRGVCPECGTPVRGTLLVLIDPAASEFQPMYAPKLTAALLTMWAWGALASALCVLLLRLNEFSSLVVGGEFPVGLALQRAPAVLMAISGIGALAHVRPHRGIPAWESMLAALGTAAYGPLVVAMWHIHAEIDAALPHPYADDPTAALEERAWWRLAAAACGAAAIVGVRPVARLMVSRCMLMRTGRVDRQTLLVIVGVLGVTMVGDVCRLLGAQLGDAWELLRPVGTAFIGVGSALIVLGLVGVVVDAWRIRYAILTPPLSLGDVLEDDARAGEKV